MKILRTVLFAATLTISLFFAVVYSACTKDRCNNVACQNGGACDNGNCVCAPGYEGGRCETYSRTKFITNFNGGDSCTKGGVNGYALRFYAVLTNPVQMTMKNFLGNNNDSATCTLEAADSFIFNGSNNSVTYRGYGILSNDSLHLSYHVQADTVNYDCTYNGLRY